ncbi:hypothetical protein O181_047767 [Austropuccinia psidii MF-1]|uniref:Integrase catalytic domain-containing protein n=1 Tax=Austropuccinia psidii MF-1 TaxID=1389203 RepID=A0A9Q3DYH6_9BASI|nr:hypothetical protein [Austropuccinia psidii MF-1]
MLGTKLAFSTAYHPHTDGLAERKIQTMEDIFRTFSFQLAYNTSQHFITEKSPSLVEKGWNPLLPVDHLKRNLLTLHPTAKDFHDMWKKACETDSKCIAEAKEYNKQRWDKCHMEPDFKKGDQVLVSTLNLNNLKGPKEMRDSFLGPLTINKLIGKNEVEVKLIEEFSRKHLVFPARLVKPYFQTEEDKFPSRKKNPPPPDKVEGEDSHGPFMRIFKSRKIRLNGKDQMHYLGRFTNQTEDKDKWLAKYAITDGNLHLRIFRASRRTGQSQK